MECVCGFRFAGPGEFRNCEAYIDDDGNGCVICPDCGRHYRSYLSSAEPQKEDQSNE